MALALSRCHAAAASSSTAPPSITVRTSVRVCPESTRRVPISAFVTGDVAFDSNQRAIASRL
jgi:hypothetical protein